MNQDLLKEEKKMKRSHIQPALLTRTEINWLFGNVKVSKPYEYRIKSDIRKKIKTFTDLELPLLLKRRIIDSLDLSIFTQNLRTNPQTTDQIIPQPLQHTEIPSEIWWAGRDLNPRTPPCQGGILTKLDHRPITHVKR